MIPPQFDYVRPADIGETLRILKEREGEAKVLAGGYSLIPLLRYRLAAPGLLVDIRDLSGLDTIAEVDGELRIGARVTHGQIASDPLIAARYQVFADAAPTIGDPQVRNWGTMGGAIAHADPSADWPAVLIATHASIVVRSLDGERVIPAREFFIDTFVTAIEMTELLTEVRVPAPRGRTGTAYASIERKAGDFATAGAAAVLRLDDDGTIAAAGIALTAVAEAQFAATHAERLLIGARPGNEIFEDAGREAAAQARPVADNHGPVEYKRAMAAAMVERALHRAAERAAAA
jgi:carbon-monoxide dehydrogenase medium subunit